MQIIQNWFLQFLQGGTMFDSFLKNKNLLLEAWEEAKMDNEA